MKKDKIDKIKKLLETTKKMLDQTETDLKLVKKMVFMAEEIISNKSHKGSVRNDFTNPIKDLKVSEEDLFHFGEDFFPEVQHF